MMAVKLEATWSTRRFLARLEREYPKTARGAHNAVASRVQNRFRKVMRVGGGCDGVHRFAPVGALTSALHASVNHPGGQLAEREVIVKYKKADVWHVGWVDQHGKNPKGSLAAWASRFQDRVSYPFTSEHKRRLAAWAKYKGVEVHGMIGAAYDSPGRPVVDPLADTVAREYPRLFLEAFNKRVRAALKRGRTVN